MSLAVSPGTCHRCKGPIQPGEDIRRYNRPAIGTLYHATCPTLAPVPAVNGAAAHHAGPLTGDAVDAIVAKVTAALARQSAPAPVPADAPDATEPECSYSQALVEDGYEPMGFDCAGFAWLPLASTVRSFDDVAQEFSADVEALLANACGTSDYYGVPAPSEPDFTSTLAHHVKSGMALDDAKRLATFADGLRAGIVLAARAMRQQPDKVETVKALTRDEWRAAQSSLSLIEAVDDAAVDAAMAQESTGAAESAPTCCTCTMDDAGNVERVSRYCAKLGAKRGAEWRAAEHDTSGIGWLEVNYTSEWGPRFSPAGKLNPMDPATGKHIPS